MPQKRITTKIANRANSDETYLIKFVYTTAAYKIKRTSTDLVQQGQTVTQQRFSLCSDRLTVCDVIDRRASWPDHSDQMEFTRCE
jgi:hypothetical protein